MSPNNAIMPFWTCASCAFRYVCIPTWDYNTLSQVGLCLLPWQSPMFTASAVLHEMVREQYDLPLVDAGAFVYGVEKTT